MIKTLLLPLLLSLTAIAQDQDKIIELTIKDHKYSLEKIEVKANQRFKIKITNADPTSEEFESKSMIVEKFIGPNKSITITLGPLKPGEYEYFGCFHPKTAKGILIAK